mmetsp:Transcript_24084/g.82363  ORF Transcript_24084/g.82363 Transcript_24084/m.82363 type:complete len:238 (+) Transcript_24084:1933-2646(+)
MWREWKRVRWRSCSARQRPPRQKTNRSRAAPPSAPSPRPSSRASRGPARRWFLWTERDGTLRRRKPHRRLVVPARATSLRRRSSRKRRTNRRGWRCLSSLSTCRLTKGRFGDARLTPRSCEATSARRPRNSSSRSHNRPPAAPSSSNRPGPGGPTAPKSKRRRPRNAQAEKKTWANKQSKLLYSKSSKTRRCCATSTAARRGGPSCACSPRRWRRSQMLRRRIRNTRAPSKSSPLWL